MGEDFKQVPRLLGDSLKGRGVDYAICKYAKGDPAPRMLSLMLDKHELATPAVMTERLAVRLQSFKSGIDFVSGFLQPIPNASVSWVEDGSIPIRYTEAYDVNTDKKTHRLDTTYTIREIDDGNSQ